MIAVVAEGGACKPPARRSIAEDARGAIALLGLFMAVFLAAVAYYLVGIGETVLYRERMQDAADAAAFSAAVLHARGMNLIALVNMTMAALLAVLVALKLLETVITIALVIIAVSSYFVPGLASAIPTLAKLRTDVRAAHDELRPPIHQMLETLHAAGVALKDVVPAASAARGAQIAGAQPGSPLLVAVAVPPRLTLPTEDGTFGELCARAGGYVGDTAELALGPVPDAIAGEVSGVLSDLASAGAEWFCGASGAQAPTSRRTERVNHPQLESRERCAAHDAAAAGYDSLRHEAECAQAEHDEAVSEPDRNGHCTGDCDPRLYEQRAARARAACAPRAGRDGLRGFSFQERRFQRSYLFRRGDWLVTSSTEAEQRSARYSKDHRDERPCGEARSEVGSEWNLELRDADARPVPLCSNARPPRSGREGQTVVLNHVEVVHIFGCYEKVTRDYGLADEDQGDRLASGEAGRSGQDGDKVPQVLAAGVELGEEPFQVRAVAIGKPPPSAPERVIDVARWRKPAAENEDAKDSGEEAAAPVAQLGQLALAQAEYFYAVEQPDAADRSSFMWNMRWQARLRRFRLPSPGGANHGDTAAAPPSVGSDAGFAVGPELEDAGALLAEACEQALPVLATGPSPCAELASTADRIAH